jgi:hypothetical protein
MRSKSSAEDRPPVSAARIVLSLAIVLGSLAALAEGGSYPRAG